MAVARATAIVCRSRGGPYNKKDAGLLGHLKAMGKALRGRRLRSLSRVHETHGSYSRSASPAIPWRKNLLSHVAIWDAP
jgi:hypothetical protein